MLIYSVECIQRQEIPGPKSIQSLCKKEIKEIKEKIIESEKNDKVV